jgi:hypothetical protein
MRSARLTVGTVSVQFTYPAPWGRVAAVQRNMEGFIAQGTASGRVFGVNTLQRGSKTVDARVFEGYVHDDPKDIVAPTVYLYVYPDPATFADDDRTINPYGLTKEGKQEALAPLLTIYADRSVAGVQAQLRQGLGDAMKLRGAWWGNLGARSDRLGIRYLENANGDLRGAGFFINEGQDINFKPTYKVVLINPEKRIVVGMYLPLEGITDLQPYLLSKTMDSMQVRARVGSGYTFLDTFASTQTQLGRFLQEAKDVARSAILE